MTYDFHQKEWRLRNATGLHAIFTIEITMLAHKNFKTTIMSWINTEKVHKIIQFNQKAWLKSYVGMNSKLKTEARNDFEKDFLEYDFWKNYETVRKHRGIKLLTKSKRRSYLVLKLHCHTTKIFSENLLAIEMNNIKVKMNKPVSLGLSILEVNKTLTYDFWYDYIQPKYKSNAKLCYMDTR